MPPKQERGPRPIYYVSPLFFALACVLLAAIIGIFAISNIQREKRLMTRALSQEGMAIGNLVSAGARTMIRRSMMRGELDEESWRQALRQFIDNGSDHTRLRALYLAKDDGTIAVHSSPTLEGTVLSEETRAFLRGVRPPDRHDPFRFAIGSGGEEVFQVARPFFSSLNGLMPHHRDMGRGRMGPRGERGLAEVDRFFNTVLQQEYLLVVELDLADYRQAVRAQLTQVALLSFILLLVGSGGIVSLMMLQGLRGSQLRLSRMRAFTDLLVSSLPIGLIATGPDARIRTCNGSACTMLGLEQDQTLGRTFAEALPDYLTGQDSPGMAEDDRTRWEVTLPAADGEKKSLHISRLVLHDDNRPAGTLLLLQDLSQVRALERALARVERDAAIGRMAAGVAHEIRNPLSSIKGLALLLRGRLDNDALAAENLDLLVAEVERLNRSIGELLDFARPGHLETTRVAVDALVARGVALLRSDAQASTVEIRESYRCRDAFITADEDKVLQVILNLGINAIQAMPDGGRLAVTTQCDERTATISIEDSGPGMAPEVLEKVFDPYFTTKPEGTGLGLSMSKKIVEDHGGSITVDSSPGAGTRIAIHLSRS
ncbi:MAG: ATP-binding protein [Desulfofustis sp.]|jgi:two-component system sensor histidine kinase HydH|nr:ATP-binding protein [Desulfofustis sp.]